MHKRFWVAAARENITLSPTLRQEYLLVLVSIAVYSSYDSENSNTPPGVSHSTNKAALPLCCSSSIPG